MQWLILLFSLFLIVLGGLLLIRPRAVFAPLEAYAHTLHLHVVAASVRILLGLLLLAVASASHFPVALQVIGAVSLAAGLLVGGLGRRRFIALMSWANNILPRYRYLFALFAIAFGAFLAYAVR